MNTVTLKKIELSNFKGIASAEREFESGVNTIKAENGAGKSTIKNAFEWLLCQNITDVLPMLNNKEIQNLVTSVTATIEVNGFEYILYRQSKGKYHLNEETGLMNKVTNECTYKIDDIEMKEKDYKEKIASLMGNGAFENLQILTDKDYFNTDTTKFKWNDRRKVLFEICGVNNVVQDIAQKEKYESIRNYIIKGYATSDIKSMLAKEKKGYKDTQTKNSILIEQKTKELNELSEINFEQVDKELKLAKTKLNKLLSASNKENQSEQIAELENTLLKLNKEKSQIAMQDMNEQNALRNLANTIYNECQNLKLQYQVEQQKLNEISQFINELKEPETICPTCKRPYTKEILKETREELDKLIEEQNLIYNNQEKIVKTIKLKYDNKKAQFDITKGQLDNFQPNEKLKKLEDAIISTQNALQSAKATDLNILSKEQIASLETQISVLERQMAKTSQIEKAKNDISVWKESSKAVADKIVEVERKEKALADYVKEQTDTIVDTINSYFSNGISWALYKEIYKNGEGGVEEDCTCMFQNKRYSSLSTGEKNKANLEVVKVLQNYYGVNIVIFSENCEANTLPYDNEGRQIIELHAVKGAKLDNVVKIEDIYGKGE